MIFLTHQYSPINDIGQMMTIKFVLGVPKSISILGCPFMGSVHFSPNFRRQNGTNFSLVSGDESNRERGLFFIE